MKTIKVDELGYNLIETARKTIETMWPTPVTQGFVTTLGVILLLQQLGKVMKNLMSSPEGLIYLKFIEVLQEQRR